MKKRSLPFVYKVENSRLIGTVHLVPNKLFYSNLAFSSGEEMAEHYLSAIDKLAVETKIIPTADTSESKYNFVSQFFDLDEQAKREFPKEEFRKDIINGVKEGRIDIDDLLNVLIPMHSYYLMPDCVLMDAEFSKYAIDKGKKIIEFEDYGKAEKAALGYFKSRSLEEKVDSVIDILIGDPFKGMERIHKIYFEQDSDELLKMTEEYKKLTEKRDPVFYEQSRPLFVEGGNAVVVGVVHCPGIIELAKRDGLRVEQEPYE